MSVLVYMFIACRAECAHLHGVRTVKPRLWRRLNCSAVPLSYCAVAAAAVEGGRSGHAQGGIFKIYCALKGTVDLTLI